jgi:hypothetical protein
MRKKKREKKDLRKERKKKEKREATSGPVVEKVNNKNVYTVLIIILIR